MQTQDNLIITNCLTALDAEIRRIRLSGRQHVVTDGTIVGNDELSTECHFTLKRPLESPDNSPVTLVVAGREYKGIVAECIDRSITIAVEGELTGRISEALLTVEPSELLRTTVKRLQELKGAGELQADQIGRASKMIRGESTARESRTPPLVGEGCSSSQLAALEKLWSHDVGYLAGASGTGRTYLLAHLAKALVHAGCRVLVVAPTNRGVDEFIREMQHKEGLTKTRQSHNNSIIRIGRIIDARLRDSHGEPIDYHQIVMRTDSLLKERIQGVNGRLKEVRKALTESDEKIRLFETRANLEKQLRATRKDLKRISGGVIRTTLRVVGLSRSNTHATESNRLSSTIKALQAGLKEIASNLKGVSLSDLTTWHAELSARESQLVEHGWSCEQERTEIKKDIFTNARMIATTPSVALAELPNLKSIDAVLIDDATTLPLPVLFALATVAKDQVVVAGDYHQLGPRAHSDHTAIERWYASDIFSLSGVKERLKADEDIPYAATLSVRYDSSNELVRLMNAASYNDTLTFQPIRPATTGWPSALGISVQSDIIAVDTTPLQPFCQTVRSSKTNISHALIIAELCARLTQGEGAVEPHQVAVIAPYRAQIDLISGCLAESSLAGITVAPLHALRGDRKKIVIADLSESAPHSLGGFAASPDKLDDPRRTIAQAINATREKLIVVGNMRYLRRKLSEGEPLTDLLDGLDMHAAYTSGLDILSTRADGAPASPSRLRILAPDQCGPTFVNELKNARSEIVLQVTELSQRRISLLIPILRRKLQEGVVVRIVQSSDSSRSAGQSRCDHHLLALLASEGILTQRSPNSEVNIACFDRRVLLIGSCSPLTHVARDGYLLLHSITNVGATLMCEYIQRRREPTTFAAPASIHLPSEARHASGKREITASA